MASSSGVVRARIDGHIKEEATNVLAGMGLSVSDAIRVLLTRIAADKTSTAYRRSPTPRSRELLPKNSKNIEARA